MEKQNKFTATAELIQQLNPWEVASNPTIKEHVTNLYNTIHGAGGEAFVEREAQFITQTILDDDKKWGVTPLSVFLAFVDLAVNNLTLEPGAQALCYLLNRSCKIPRTDKEGKIIETWENRCYLAITGYGEIYARQREGQILHCDNPTVVYAGDQFSYTESEGRKQVSYSLNLAHDISCPVACFMKITRPDNTTDYAIILPEGWARLSEYSRRQNARQLRDKEKARPNALYTAGPGGSIDPGFLIAKCVKQAFKNYPKRRVGKGSVMMADLPEEETVPDYYNLESKSGDQPPRATESFAEPSDLSGGVTVDPAAGADPAADDGTW